MNAIINIIRDICELHYDAGGFDEEDMAAVSITDLRRILVRHLAAPAVANAAKTDELPPLTMAVYGTNQLLEAERHRRCSLIAEAGEAKAEEFEAWAKLQTPPYYLKLNKYRLNEGNRWYDNERTQHTFEGFVKGRAAIASLNKPVVAMTDEKLVAALKELCAMYGSTWDSVDGSLVMMGDGVDRFEKAHAAGIAAIAAHAGQGAKE